MLSRSRLGSGAVWNAVLRARPYACNGSPHIDILSLTARVSELAAAPATNRGRQHDRRDLWTDLQHVPLTALLALEGKGVAYRLHEVDTLVDATNAPWLLRSLPRPRCNHTRFH